MKRLLSSTCLLTLTGSGGCGKTRLALQVAADLVGDSEAPGADGIWLVELAALTDPALVPQVVAFALGAPEATGHDPADRLVALVAGIGGFILLSGQAVAGSTVSLGLIVAFIAYTQRFNQPISQISAMWTNVQSDAR